MSIAMEVASIAERQVRPEDVPRIVEVALEVGDDAGVEVESLAFCLEVVLSTPPFQRAKPVIQRVPGDVLRVDYLEVDDGVAEEKTT